MKKRKPWRNYKKHSITRSRVRWLCMLLIVLELWILGRKGLIPIPTIEVRRDSQAVTCQIREEEEPKSSGESDSRVYGIRFRIKEGTIEFYENRRQENSGEIPVFR